MVNEKSKIEMPNQFWNFIIETLGRLPYNQSAPIIQEMEKQIMAQQSTSGV